MEDMMAWTKTTRELYRRDELRYPSDVRDEEWALIAPFMPVAKPMVPPPPADLREVVNALL